MYHWTLCFGSRIRLPQSFAAHRTLSRGICLILFVQLASGAAGSTRLADLHTADRQQSGSRRLQQTLNYQEPTTPTFTVFSALHDKSLGQVRISAEVYPDEVCSLVETCQVDGPSGHYQVPATSQMPFGTWGVSGPQLRECFVHCNFPETGLDLNWAHLRDAEDQLMMSHALEEVLLPVNMTGGTQKRGVGICSGPVFSSVPTFADWVQYHAELGVEGMHLYMVAADFVLAPRGGGYTHTPGNYKPVSIENHRLLHWRTFYPSPWSTHYYGQWLIYNDCVFRWRHMYEYLVFLDRDEFLHFPQQRHKQVDLRQQVAALFEGQAASVALHSALHPVRCLTRHVQLLGVHNTSFARSLWSGIDNVFTQTYEGHDLWARAPEAPPDFSPCFDSKTGIGCHPKSVVRPLAVALMDVDFAARVEEGFERHPEAVDPGVAHVKHLRCLLNPQSHLWEQDPEAPLCKPRAKPDHSSGGLVVCPPAVAAPGKVPAKGSSVKPK